MALKSAGEGAHALEGRICFKGGRACVQKNIQKIVNFHNPLRNCSIELMRCFLISIDVDVILFITLIILQ